MPPKRDVSETDRAKLLRAVAAERKARETWNGARIFLEDTIRIAVANGASLRSVAKLVDLSHGRVRDIIKQMPLDVDDYFEIVNGEE